MSAIQDFTIEDVLSEYDRDGDGFISLTEFIGDVRGNGVCVCVCVRASNTANTYSC